MNNPIRYTDPSGHGPCEDYQGACLSEDQMTDIWNSTHGSDDDPEHDPEPEPERDHDSGNNGCDLKCQHTLNVIESLGLNCTPEGGCYSPLDLQMPNLPQTLVLHPLDSRYIEIRTPIYDNSYSPPKMIGYRVTSYAYDSFHFDPWALNPLPSFDDPISSASAVSEGVDLVWNYAQKGANQIIGSLFKQFADDLAIAPLCPECSAVLGALSYGNQINNGTTIDAHLVTYDVYFTDRRFDFQTPFDPVPIQR